MRPMLLAAALLCATLWVAALSPPASAACAPNIEPWATAGSGETVAVFTELAFNGEGGDTDGTIDLYEWDFDDDGEWDYSNGQSAVTSWTYTQLGLFDATLRVTDDCGGTALDVRQVHVIDNNKLPTAEAGENIITEVGQLVTFVGEGLDEDGRIIRWEWDFTDDGVYDRTSSSNGTATWVYNVPGMYTARLRVTDSGSIPGNDTDSINVQVHELNLPPQVSVGSRIDTYALMSIEFRPSASDPDGKIVEYSWDFEDDGTVDQSSHDTGSAAHVYERQGTFKAKLTVTDDGPLIKSASTLYTVVVKAENQPPAADAGADLLAEVGQAVRVSGNGSDPDGQIVLYQWDFDADGEFDLGNVASGVGLTVYDHAGIFELTFQVKDDAGATARDSIKVTVSDPPKVVAPTKPLIEIGLGFFLAIGLGLGAGVAAGAMVGRTLAVRAFERRLNNVSAIEGGATARSTGGGAAPMPGPSTSIDDEGFRDRGLGGASGPSGAPPPAYGQYGSGYQQQAPPPPPGYGGDGSYRPPPPY